jgi:hypothetical protein
MPLFLRAGLERVLDEEGLQAMHSFFAWQCRATGDHCPCEVIWERNAQTRKYGQK